MVAGIEQTLIYWFGQLTEDGLPADDRMSLWFGKDDAQDAEIRRRFSAQLADASANALDHWCNAPSGLIALVVTLDQFSRNIFRDTPAAFAADPKALSLANNAVEHGLDRSMPWIHRVFLYMPLEHAEDPLIQELSVRCFESLAVDAVPAARLLADNFLDYARKHRDIVVRFGRFPHRNNILGRPSSARERAFLREPDSSF
ncbi:MAG: DUF924 family protein [Aquisalimonadaceae bacterium]